MTNDFLVFSGDSAANVIDQSNYAAMAARIAGFQSGVAQSAQLNKVWRQSSIMSAVLAQFIADVTSQDVVDDGTVPFILANLKTAIALQAPGRLLAVRRFAASTTYTPTAGTRSVHVICQAGGGGGGGCDATGASQCSAGAGGGAGGWSESYLTSGFSGVAITVGAGGSTTVAGAGGSGGSSSFGALLSAGGGGGGTSGPVFPPPTLIGSGGGSVGSGGNVANGQGGNGASAFYYTTGNAQSGVGGGGRFGVGGPGIGPSSNNGIPGFNSGSGGSGGVNTAFSSAKSGGVGAPGAVIVWEFA